MFDYRIEDYSTPHCQISLERLHLSWLHDIGGSVIASCHLSSQSLEQTARTDGEVIGFIIPCIEQMTVGVIVQTLQR